MNICRHFFGQKISPLLIFDRFSKEILCVCLMCARISLFLYAFFVLFFSCDSFVFQELQSNCPGVPIILVGLKSDVKKKRI